MTKQEIIKKVHTVCINLPIKDRFEPIILVSNFVYSLLVDDYIAAWQKGSNPDSDLLRWAKSRGWFYYRGIKVIASTDNDLYEVTVNTTTLDPSFKSEALLV